MPTSLMWLIKDAVRCIGGHHLLKLAKEVKALCRHMDVKNLKEIVQLWNSCHDANLALVDLTMLEDVITSKSEKNA